MRLEIHYKEKKTLKNTNTWRINNILLNNQWITEEIKEEIKKYLDTNENQNTTIWNVGGSKSSSKGEVHSNTTLPQERRKISNINNLILHQKQLEKEEQTNSKGSIRKEIIKIRAEINEIEIKKTIEKVNETKSWFFEKIKNW